ncbi:multimerin-2-like isoform X2 [Mercenaria mercenaria]|uniref:multimerin-2-like isoform X2 n=1 Tax=Mercenaria mercenaria TaxID=6596 RepID=UPI00234EBA0F|nr:multimerin-2-like isoform X2 [Mercenaria mercenaria]
MATYAIALLFANIYFATLAASQPLELDLVQIIKHLQDEGMEFKRRLGILEDTIHLQEDTIHLQQEHIKKQDKRIQVLENIIKSRTDEISLQDPIRNINSDSEINNDLQEHWTEELEKENAESKTWGNTVSEDMMGNKTRNKTKEPYMGTTHRVLRSMTGTPSPVAFHASLSGDLHHIAKHQTISFGNIVINIGGGYHTHHGLFTAPKPGIYIFSLSVLVQPHYHIEAQIMKNGQGIQGVFGNAFDNTGFNQASGSAVLQLSIGDEVWVETTEWSPNTELRGGDYTSFMGCLIMEL